MATITFQCEHCGKEVETPDSATGKRGKCPFCGGSNFIPAPVAEEDIIPLAPVNKEEEHRREEEVRRLMEQERDIIAATGGEPEIPLEHREDLAPEDMYHFVVNYCVDMLDSNLARSDVHLRKLKQFRGLSTQAVEDFRKGKADEPILKRIPKKVLNAFLDKLRSELK